MGREEEQKKGGSKGFAGLSSLVSDVDTPLPLAAKTEPAASASSTERPAPQAAQSQPSQQHQTYQEPAQPPSSGPSGSKWVLGVAVIIGVAWLIGQSDKSQTSPAPAYSPPMQTARTAQTPTPSYSPPAEPQAPSRPQESIPPVGQDLVFSTAQISYCLAEDIRMEGTKSALNNYIDSDVDRFNAMVADFNSRCGSFRYRNGALESARRDVELYRIQLLEDGRNNFARQIGVVNRENSPSTLGDTQRTENLPPVTMLSVPSAQDYLSENWTWGEFKKRIAYHRLGVNDQINAWSHYRNNIIPVIANIENKNTEEEQGNFDKLIPAPGVLMPLSGNFIIKSAKANVRSEPSSDNATTNVVKELVKGDQAVVIGYSADFFKVTTSDGSTGFIHRSVGIYVKPND